jgi:hypothetical protein
MSSVAFKLINWGENFRLARKPESRMNPITQTKNLMKINDRELEMGVAGTKNSWHQEYKVTGLFLTFCLKYLMRVRTAL